MDSMADDAAGMDKLTPDEEASESSWSSCPVPGPLLGMLMETGGALEKASWAGRGRGS